MSNIPGLFVLGEANFSVHGANRLGASALMQGLADGYFVIPYTVAHYLTQTTPGIVSADHAECRKTIEDVKAENKRLLSIKGNRTVTEFMRELGTLMWNNVGMARSKEGLTETIMKIPGIRERRGDQPAAGERRPHGGFSGVRRAALPRRPPPQRVVRRPLPGGVPDGGR
jgi:succinate dehydrogenase / fumarate reductase flavoprotein subunit